jgi:hypothetical protein
MDCFVCKNIEKTAIFQFFMSISRNRDTKTRLFGDYFQFFAIFALQNILCSK